MDTKTYQPSSRVAIHPLLQVGEDLVAQLHDYPTLMCLSMTCRTFYHLITRRHTVLQAAFLRLEVETQYDGQRVERPVPIRAHKCHPLDDMRPWTWVKEQGFARLRRVPSPNIKFDCDYDLLRFNTGRLPTLDWLPCYGCMRIKHRATHFFRDYSVVKLDYKETFYELLACQALRRRCISCCHSNDTRPVSPPIYTRQVSIGNYKYVLRCSLCFKFGWISQPPEKAQISRNLCSGCFRKWLAEDDNKKLLQRDWKIFAAMPIEHPRKKRRKMAIHCTRETALEDISIFAIGDTRSLFDLPDFDE